MAQCKYRIRWFSSKGAYLVLLWTFLIFVVCFSFFHLLKYTLQKHDHLKLATLYFMLMMVLLSAPLSGWLADAKFGNYKVFRAGADLLFISTVMNCLLMVLEELVWKSHPVVILIHVYFVGSLFVIGGCACLATALPLGLDQMPDASSSNITSYIAWFVCSIFTAYLTGQVLGTSHLSKLHFTLIWALCLTVCMTVILTSIFLFSPQWLIIEPKAPQSLKTMYQVLKFAVKHKTPLNRSAFTYWEEDIPSRIDLGKSKYGGPFTTEQVEDVKTVLHLIAISLPFSFIIFASIFQVQTIVDYPDVQLMNYRELLLSKISIFSIIGSLLHEFVIYPLLGHRFPSILKRIGAVSLVITLTSLVCFILKLVHYLSHSDETVTEWIVLVLSNLVGGLLFQALLTSMTEFLSAQTPYNMRGMLVTLGLSFIAWSVIGALTIKAKKLCTNTQCSLVMVSVKTVVSLIGFLLFCVVGRWYKRRVRDEDYSTQRVVEEVYDRYLTAAAESKSINTFK